MQDIKNETKKDWGQKQCSNDEENADSEYGLLTRRD